MKQLEAIIYVKPVPKGRPKATKIGQHYRVIAAIIEQDKKTASLFQSAQAEAVNLLKDLTDPDDCSLDHHGYCQTHGWLQEGLCPHFRAKMFLQALSSEGEGREFIKDKYGYIILE